MPRPDTIGKIAILVVERRGRQERIETLGKVIQDAERGDDDLLVVFGNSKIDGHGKKALLDAVRDAGWVLTFRAVGTPMLPDAAEKRLSGADARAHAAKLAVINGTKVPVKFARLGAGES